MSFHSCHISLCFVLVDFLQFYAVVVIVDTSLLDNIMDQGKCMLLPIISSIDWKIFKI
jgi:hypothetical protein